MKRRSVRHDPIATNERERGAVVMKMFLDMDRAVAAERSRGTDPAADKVAVSE